MSAHRSITNLIAAIASIAISSLANPLASAQHEAAWENSVERAIAYLSVEVEKWRKENGCFSCHNNGDGARALYLARQLGLEVPESALTETTEWLRRPERWDSNSGDPVASDKKLARMQFSFALIAASASDESLGSAAINGALKRLLADQTASGSWAVDSSSEIGSPVTWGNPLATLFITALLASQDIEESNTAYRSGASKGINWLLRHRPKSTIGQAVLLSTLNPGILPDESTFTDSHAATAETSAQVCQDLLSHQSSDGGWGPYADTQSEVFDTAVVMLLLTAHKAADRACVGMEPAINQARLYLIRSQSSAGGWPETTRPSGGQSYAQHISTTAWALMALLISPP